MKDTTNIKKSTDLEVLKPQDLTKSAESVNYTELPKYWDRDYINAKLQNIKNLNHQILLEFLWMSGVRISEALSLPKKNLDFENYMATVRWLKSRKYHYRTLPLYPLLVAILKVYTAGMKAEDLIFPITRQRAWQLCRKYLQGSPHQLRHSFAVNWLRCGGDIVVLHRILGHASIRTTMEYLKIVPVDQGKELQKVKFR